MGYSGGVIYSPVSMADVNAVLGRSHTDLMTMCKDEYIKWFSKYKPTSHTGIGFIDAMRGAPINGVNFGCGLSVPSFPIDTTATVTLGSGSTISLIQYLEHWQSSYGQYAIVNTNAAALGNKWAKPNITVARLTDFYRYSHLNPQYEYGTRPFSCSVALPQQGGRGVIDASAQIVYNYADKEHGLPNLGSAWLGVNTLFCQDSGQGEYGGISMTINGYSGTRFFTVIVYCAQTGKMLISRQAFKTITTDADSESGLSYNRYVAIPTSGVVGTNFPEGSTVLVAPCIMARSTNGNYIFFSLNCVETYSKNFTLRSDTPVIQGVHINSISATITYERVSGRTYDIYFSGASAFTVSCSGASSDSDRNKVFYTNNIMYIGPADATGSTSTQSGLTLGAGYDSNNGYRYTNVTSNSPQGYIFNGGNFSPSSFRSRMTFSGSGSSAQVGVSIPVYHNNGSGTMVRKVFNLTFTIDPTKTGSNTASASAT